LDGRGEREREKDGERWGEYLQLHNILLQSWR
jgi:hypothetical protein